MTDHTHIEGAKKIVLMLNTTSLFAADVSYHPTCYDSFRTSWWEKKLESLNSSTNNPDVEVTNDTPINELFHLIHYYIIHRREIYSVAQLRHFYEQLNEKEEHSVLRSIDMKGKLIVKCKQKLVFRKFLYSTSNKSEYVVSSEESLVPNCLESVILGGLIPKSLYLKNTATAISHDIQEQIRKNQTKWPSSPQEVLDDVQHYHSDSLYNLIAWIVNQTSSYDENGIVKVSKPKATNVSKICDDIKSLIPNSCPSLSQLLLSLNVYRKTGPSVIVNDLHKIGRGILYTETKLIEDKWGEWSGNTSNIVPENIKQGVVVTHVVDNIEWKNKSFKGKETHNTNSILIQQISYSSHPTTGLNIIPHYNFNRSQHLSFNGFKKPSYQIYTS